MHVSHPEFKDLKKLLIDLDLTQTEVGRAVGISQWAVNRYLCGELKNPDTRRAIKRVLARRARQRHIRLPEIWPDVKKA